MGPLISERDLYLAWSLKRSKAVNGARRVVGVVGKGHLRGVCYALTHDAGGRAAAARAAPARRPAQRPGRPPPCKASQLCEPASQRAPASPLPPLLPLLRCPSPRRASYALQPAPT